MAFVNGAGFRVCGAVVRRYVNPGGTFAAVTLDVTVDGRSKKMDARAFSKSSPEVIDDITKLGAGMTIEITGSIDMEGLTNDKKEPIKNAKGYQIWTPVLTIKKLSIEGSSKPAAPPAAAKPPLPPLDDEKDPEGFF